MTKLQGDFRRQEEYRLAINISPAPSPRSEYVRGIQRGSPDMIFVQFYFNISYSFCHRCSRC